MRYWNFQLAGAPNGGWSSHVNGQMDPGAPLVEFDITTETQDVRGTSGYLQIWGQPISVIAMSQQFYGKKYSLSVGMATGLPLATAQASEAGMILGGTDTITGVFSHFQGTEQWVGFGLGGYPASMQTPPPSLVGNQMPPRNIVLNWRKGTPLAQALTQTFKTAFPEMTSTVSVSSNIVAPQDNIGYFGSMNEFATYLRQATRATAGNATLPYDGVAITMGNGKITAFDGTGQASTKTIQFTDLIGQPTFIARNQLQVKVVMRGDLSVGNQITLPANVALNVSGNLGVNASIAVTGTWTITSLRWVGNSRQADGNSWATIIVAQQAPGGTSP